MIWGWLIAPRSRTSKKKNLSRRRYFRLSEGLTRQHFYQNDFCQNDSSFSLLLFQNNVRKFVFVLQIDRVFCTWFVTLWKTSSPRNPPTSQKLLPFNPPSPSEFPMVFRGGGMDIFWNHTFKNRCQGGKHCLMWWLVLGLRWESVDWTPWILVVI